MDTSTASVNDDHYAVCIYNSDVPAALELRKLYEVLPDSASARLGMIRVVNESGEDYLYPASWFAPISRSSELRLALKLAS